MHTQGMLLHARWSVMRDSALKKKGTWLLPLAIACLLFAPSVLVACDAMV